jgi:hypothetical protein
MSGAETPAYCHGVALRRLSERVEKNHNLALSRLTDWRAGRKFVEPTQPTDPNHFLRRTLPAPPAGVRENWGRLPVVSIPVVAQLPAYVRNASGVH